MIKGPGVGNFGLGTQMSGPGRHFAIIAQYGSSASGGNYLLPLKLRVEQAPMANMFPFVI